MFVWMFSMKIIKADESEIERALILSDQWGGVQIKFRTPKRPAQGSAVLEPAYSLANV